jgi:hypothetical protein
MTFLRIGGATCGKVAVTILLSRPAVALGELSERMIGSTGP